MIRGLAAHELVTVTLRSLDAQRTLWQSSALFRADKGGQVKLWRAAARAGSYTGVWGMGLFAKMKPAKKARTRAYSWGRTQRFTVAIRARGRQVASTVLQRGVPAHAVAHETLSEAGFVGTYWGPQSPSGKGPALLALGGSRGGEGPDLLGALLAAHGYPTLVVSYFNGAGLPQSLSNIPLEYFAQALNWLRHQPNVAPNRVFTLGISRGSEAALLLAVHYPNMVHGVIASVPSNVALCSFPECNGPAWTLKGQPVPYTRQINNPDPTDNPAAVIPVEQIRGPIFLDCGVLDNVWASCSYATAIVHRLNLYGTPYQHVLYEGSRASHFVGGLVPYEPTSIGNDPNDERAREVLWPRLLRFLAGVH